jgi:hypothetical protein
VPPGDWPLRAITMGIGTIRAARRILVLATGESKVTAGAAPRPRARRSALAVLVPAHAPEPRPHRGSGRGLVPLTSALVLSSRAAGGV